MLAVSNEYSEAILSDVRDMPYRVTMAGYIVMDQSQVPNMSLNESVSASNGLSLGTANAAELTLTLRNPVLTNFNGMLVVPESGLVLPDGTTEWVPLGKFWVTKVSTSNDYKTVRLTCVDGMYRMSGDFVSNLTYPTDIRTFVHEIVAQAGIDFVEPDEWPDVIVRVKPERMTLRAAIGYAAGCCGKNARFNRAGKLEFVWYEDTGISIERTAQYLDGMTKLNDKPLEVRFEVTGAQEKYKVTINAGEHGSAYATPQSNVLEGDTVSISIRPDSHYETASVTAVTDAGDPVTLSVDAEGSGYTFVQPDSNVTITVAFVSKGLRELTVRSEGGGYVTHSAGGHDEGDQYFQTGDKVQLYVSPYAGCAMRGFTTIPASLSPVYVGVSDTGELIYEMSMPDCDATVIANFAEDVSYTIECTVVDIGTELLPGVVLVENTTAPGEVYRPGNTITVQFKPTEGFKFNHFESNADMLQIDENIYQFTMPAYDVTIVAYFEVKRGKYSWMQRPVPPSEEYQYWVVEYYGDYYSSCSNDAFSIVWFKSWVADMGGIVLRDCMWTHSKCTDNGLHEWDNEWYEEEEYNLFAEDGELLGVVASNVTFVDEEGAVLFEANSHEISEPQTSCVIDGMDVREKDLFLRWHSGPNPDDAGANTANWMIIDNHDVSIFSELNENGVYDPISEVTRAVVFFDNLSAKLCVSDWSFDENGNPHKHWEVEFTNGYYADRTEFEEDWTLTRIPDGFVWWISDTEDLNLYHLIGACTCDIVFDGKCVFRKNDCKIRGSAIEPAASTFSMRSARFIMTDPVTLTYTNPLIYEKMVPGISEVVQNITYTPAKVKHRGNPAFQAGDIVTVPDGDGVYHTVLIMQQTLTFGGGMNSEITCPGQTADTANFSAASPQTTQIKMEVDKATAQLEHEMAVNSAAVYSALYKAFGTSAESLQNQMNNQTETSIEHDERISDLETSLSYAEADVEDMKGRVDTLEAEMGDAQAAVDGLEARVAAIEDAGILGQLKRELATTDQQIAHCAEIFMLEVLVTGTAPAAVVLPYDISALHTTRETLRTQIAELEAETNE